MDISPQEKLQDFGDLELAVLISLVAQQHCIVSSIDVPAQDLCDELRLICNDTFGLQTATIECSKETTIDDFNEALLVDVEETFEDARERRETMANLVFSVDFSPRKERSPARFSSVGNAFDDRRIADVVIVTNLAMAGEGVQVQALELLRTKRIFTRTSMHTASKDFLFVAVTSKPEARLSHHLNDLFCLSHFHEAEDGLARLDGQLTSDNGPTLSMDDVRTLRSLTEETRMTAEVASYLHNIVVFMRRSRFIKGGVTPTATRQFRELASALAPLHGLDYVPPSLVALAARKIYPHRLVLVTPDTERSLQWGSDPEAVRQMLEGVTVEDVIEMVLAEVETPL